MGFVSFQVLIQLGGCTNFSRKDIKGQGGGYKASVRFTRLEGLKRIRLKIADRPIDYCNQQDAKMGFPALWNTCSGYQHYCS